MTKILCLLVCWVAAFTLKAQPHIFENAALKATVNLSDASLVGFESKATAWNILSSPDYGQSFEMNIKLKDGSFRIVHGKSQGAPKVTVSKEELLFIWDGIKVGAAEIDVIFEGRIKTTEQGLVYSGKLINKSEAVIEQLSWPCIGNISIPEKTEKMWFQFMTYTTLNAHELYPRYSNTGWSNLPEHSFTLIHNRLQGVYLSSLDPRFEEYIRCVHETLPTEAFAALAGAPGSQKDHAERKAMKTQVKAARMLFLQPGAETSLVPFLVTPYVGSWHEGVDIYKAWRKTWYAEPPRADWVKKVNAWQQLQINSSESRINFTIKDLRKYVSECKRYGVDAIQLTGWTRGGQDRGLPSHDLDPRLGTAEEFKKEIKEAAKLGVKILLFTKFTWTDMTDALSPDWAPHIAQNDRGKPCIHPGYNYNTYTQLLGINTRRFGIFCMMDSALRIKLGQEFQKCLDLGAPGMVYDENQHHAGTMLCFNPSHGHKVPGFVYQGADKLGREFMAQCQKSNPDFLMTGEGPYDIQTQYYATYTRADHNSDPALRYIDPTAPIACAVTDHYDKNQINMCLANRYAVSYEPRYFKGRLSEMPRVISYGQQVDKLRKRYSDYLWDAEFIHTKGAAVAGADLKYAVFVNKRGQKAVVIFNTHAEKSVAARLTIEGAVRQKVIVTPEKQEPVSFNGEPVNIAPQSAVVVLEK